MATVLQRRMPVALPDGVREVERKLDGSLWVCIDRPPSVVTFCERYESGDADQDDATVLETESSHATNAIQR